MATCQYQTGDRTCREATHPGSACCCILHEPDASKDRAAFLKALRDKVDREEADGSAPEVDLAGVVFPPGFRWAEVRDVPLAKSVSFVGTTFAGDANFGGATFSGDANFESTTFTRAAYFGGAKFAGDVNFGRATFSGNANFESATFTGDAYLMGATFSGHADFGGATFTGNANFGRARFEDWLRFQGTRFPHDEGPGLVTFVNVTLKRPDLVSFQNVNLSRTSFLGTDLRRVNFLNTTWAKLAQRPRPLPPLPGRQGWAFTLIKAIWRRRAK